MKKTGYKEIFIFIKIKKQMTEELKNDALASCYAVTTAFRGYGSTRHGVRAEKGKIKIQ